MTDLSGRGALVTGAGRGIGQACAFALGEAGARLFVVDREMASLEETLAALHKAGVEASGYGADVADEGQVEAMVAEGCKRLGKLDIAINCAAIYDSSPGEAWDLEDFDRVMRVNVRGVYTCLKAECDRMAESGGGAIVNLASIAGLRGGRGIAYGASKHAVVGLTKSIALLYAGRGLRINALCPGPTETQMLRDVATVNAGAELASSAVPLGRKAQPREIAAAALWLVSDAASYATGMAMPVDGGLMAG